MSLEDESFPNDELLELDLSTPSLGRYQLPQRMQEQQQQEHAFSGKSNKNALLHPHNLSATSSTGNQTVSSAECATEQPAPTKVQQPITTDERMVKSDEIGISSKNRTKQQTLLSNNIHSEYTKRRYKHVESKVGQYIANIRNEDERRKRKLSQFQRHNSLPEIPAHDGQAIKPMGLQRSATIVAEQLNRALVGVIDNVDENAEEEEEEDNGIDVPDTECMNSTATTSVTLSTQGSSGRGSAQSDEQQRESDESAEDVGRSVDCKLDSCIQIKNALALLLEKHERVQSYSDYQQVKLDEKQSEITRLRKDKDYLRERLSKVEDLLKRSTNGRSLTLTGVTGGGVFGGGGGAGRQSLQSTLYCAAKSTKATQTDKLQLIPTRVQPPTPPPPPPPSPLPLDLGIRNRDVPSLYVTPDTPERSNSMGKEGAVEDGARNIKTVATIQPMSLNFSNYVDGESAESSKPKDSATLRRRSNSLASRQQKRTQTNSGAAANNKPEHNSRSSHPSSSDSAIDVEVIDLSTSPKPLRRNRYTTVERSEFGSYAPKTPRYFPYSRDQRTPSPMGLYITNCPNSTALDISLAGEAPSARRLLSKPATTGFGERRAGKKSLSRRWLHLFGSCIRCANPQRVDNEQFALQQTYTQVPLLESTFDRSCAELRSQ